MVWLVRVLIIGTFSVAGERLFSLADVHNRYSSHQNNSYRSVAPPQPQTSNQSGTNYPRPAPKPRPAPSPSYNNNNRPDPTYHPVGMTAMGRNENNNNSSSTRR